MSSRLPDPEPEESGGFDRSQLVRLIQKMLNSGSISDAQATMAIGWINGENRSDLARDSGIPKSEAAAFLEETLDRIRQLLVQDESEWGTNDVK
jgi:hypothetical protein